MTTKWTPPKGSPDWERFLKYLESELLGLYKRLSRLDMSQTETEQVRGQIAYINKLLGLSAAPNTAADKED